VDHVKLGEGAIRRGLAGDLVLVPMWPHEAEGPADIETLFGALVDRHVSIYVKLGERVLEKVEVA